jgi:hypothetical protein
VWAGESLGDLCDACDQVIAPGEMEYEANVADPGTFRFHRRCFDAWHEERARLLPESPGATPSIAEALWRFLERRRGEMFCAQCLTAAVATTGRLDRALLGAEGRGARRRHGRCSACGKDRLLCGLASN